MIFINVIHIENKNLRIHCTRRISRWYRRDCNSLLQCNENPIDGVTKSAGDGRLVTFVTAYIKKYTLHYP